MDLGDKFFTSKVKAMPNIFYNTGYANRYFEIDLTTFDFSNFSCDSSMFGGWKTTNKIYVKNAADQAWIINNCGNSSLTTSNVLIKT